MTQLQERLQCSSLSVSEYFCGSINCLNSFTPPEARVDPGIVSFSATIRKSKILENIIDQSIGFFSSTDSLEFKNAMIDQAVRIVESSSNWKFFFDGPPHSGASTILGLVAVEAVNRTKEDTFVFALNWANIMPRVTDLQSLFEIVVTQTINALGWQCGRIFPVVQQLVTYFTSFPASSIVPSLPLSVANLPLFPTSMFELFTKSLFTAIKSNDELEFIRAIVSFPVGFSNCFGFRDVLFIYDHIDVCDVSFGQEEEDAERRDKKRRKKKVSMLDMMIACISSHKFMVTSRSPQTTSSKLSDSELEYISMEHFIPQSLLTSAPVIVVKDPPMKLNIDICSGCPAFAYKYMSIVKLLKEVDQEIKEKDPKRGFMSVSVQMKRKMAKVQLLQLVRDLLEAQADIPESLPEAIMESDNAVLYLVSLRKGK